MKLTIEIPDEIADSVRKLSADKKMSVERFLRSIIYELKLYTDIYDVAGLDVCIDE